jgi:eukaryotic-like serine/threonine-protein kinase
LTVRRCSEGHAIPVDAPELLCPQCLVELATPPSVPTRLGPFRLLELLGEGGFGRVYRAQRDGEAHTVALKLLRHHELIDEESVARFRHEPTVSARLDPRYVVPVLESGQQDSVPYFTMEYMPGGTLRERMPQYLGNPQRAAELMIRIAEAVQYLHRDVERPTRDPILHRDLKPENILFGADGEPRLSDFGTAKLAKGERWVMSRVVGCPAYMAPEQLYPTARRELTAAADVYALGAISYELFTGRPPFDGTDPEIVTQLRDQEPLPPRRLAPRLDRFLETVVLNALEKDPSRRYGSAAAFAQDLRRALQRKPPEEAPPIPLAARLRGWLRRHPLRAALCAWLVTLLGVVAFSLHATLATRGERLEHEQQTNASIAAMQAVAVNLQLRVYKERVSQLARDPEVLALFEETAIGNPSPVLVDRLSPFETMFVLAPTGLPRARTSRKSAEYLARSFAFRDYFRSAQALARETCVPAGPGAAPASAPRAFVARAHLSENDGRFEFAISVPICRGSTWLGLLAGTVATDNVLGAVRVSGDRNGRVAAVLGPRDRDRATADRPLPDDLSFIVHPGLAKGQQLKLLQPEPAVIRGALGVSLSTENRAATDSLRYAAPFRIDAYHDPVPGYEGTWSAVFATADESGYIVAVSSRRHDTSIAGALLSKLAVPAGVPLSLALAGLVMWLGRRRPGWSRP